VRFLPVIGVLGVMLLAAGCGGHGCKSFNETVCNRAAECGFVGCNVDSCPGHEQVDFSACIDATKASTCENLRDTAFGCYVVRG
jgi:hypothetical protein